MRPTWGLLALLLIPTAAAMQLQQQAHGHVEAVASPATFSSGDNGDASLGSSAASATITFDGHGRSRGVALYAEAAEDGWTATIRLQGHAGLDGAKAFSVSMGGPDAEVKKHRLKGDESPQILIVAGAALRAAGEPLALEAGTKLPIAVVAPKGSLDWHVEAELLLTRQGVIIRQDLRFAGGD